MTQDAPSDAPRTLPDICQLLRRKIIAFLEEQTDDEELRNVQSQVRVSMRVIEEALSRYGPEQLAIAYNGGKDCIVLLVLILACLPTWTSSSTSESKTASAINTTDPPPISSEPSTASSVLPSLQAVYIIAPNPFPEVEEFVETSTKEYHLDLARYALPMRPALEAYLGDKPAVKAIFVGTRRTDPHGEFLTHFDPTDKDWPQFMRIHPVIDWHYTDIWTFIRRLDIPYCVLYNRGFTSLGGMTNTHRNPALALDTEAKTFRPAYELKADNEERLGRDP